MGINGYFDVTGAPTRQRARRVEEPPIPFTASIIILFGLCCLCLKFIHGHCRWY